MGVKNVDIETFYSFMQSARTYDYILSDEVQDLTPSVLSAMENRGSHVVVAGDENQSIYDIDPKYRERTVDPDQIDSILKTNDFELGIIHRLGSSIINAVQKFLPSINIFSAKKDMTKSSTEIRLCKARNSSDEAKYIMREATAAVSKGFTAAILIPTHDAILSFIKKVLTNSGREQWTVCVNKWGKTDYRQLNVYLQQCGLPLQYVGNGYGDFSNGDKICIMTYHSSKGLDFDNVFLPGLDYRLFINRNEGLSERLFMVAMTRSRNNLYLTYNGNKHDYLNNFAADCHEVDITEALSAQDNINSGVNIFGI